MKEVLKNHANNFKLILSDFVLNLKAENFGEKALKEAILYSLTEGNPKFIRSFLCYEGAKMTGKETDEDVKKIAIAIEMMHCYSLIHDYLPCMDNSDFRRGVLACHKKFGESTAVLSANALQVMAFEVLSGISKVSALPKVIKEFCNVSGFCGIMSGQVLDLEKTFKQKEFDTMNYKKTGVLIEFCLTSVAILFEKQDLMAKLKNFGKNLGLLYQMQDDMIDEGEESYSYINHFKGRANLAQEILKLANYCKKEIASFPKNQVLIELVNFVIEREA